MLVLVCSEKLTNVCRSLAHANAIEQCEFADVDRDQRTAWRERYIGACMQGKGFSDPQFLFK